jgi:salicylate hydroxylase
MSSPASRIVIIGAGIGGLTLALLLRRRGIIAEILEQAPELREVGAAVALAANGTRVLQHLDLGDGLAQASSEFTETIHRDGRDGSRIAAHVMGRQYREAFGAPMFGLHRIAPRSTPTWWWAPTACTRRCAAGSPAATSRATPRRRSRLGR